MVAEVFAGIGAFKTMFDIAKSIKDMDVAANRNAAVIELQEQILSAQEQQSTLIQKVGALEAEVARLKTWEAEKQRYELKPLGTQGIVAYALKADAQSPEPPHWICPDCYQKGEKSILQQQTRYPGRTDVRLCQRCGWEIYVSGGWMPDHAKAKRSH